jgi:Tol biopolymer transport system component
MLRSAALCTLLGLAALPAAGQGPDASWETLSTAHFRVYYPAASATWTRHAVARLESIWARVEEEVGYRPPEVIDVLVEDPIASANGSALPFLGWPRMVLWTNPPDPESVIGHYTDWSELLLVHEETHLAHLLRPSRNPLDRALAHLLPLGPVARRSPRWVSEGYATVVEGRLTGSGRPNGDLRAALLRRRAEQGKLPSYGALNSDRTWYGSSMAYLMGSAFLEWLDARAGGGSLPKLWARLSARAERSFDDAFRGVYGETPADLYGRFTAELTWQAVEVERRLRPAVREGALWQDLSWDTGTPALAPDGSSLALVRRYRDRPSELVVWSTAPDPDAERKWEEERRKIAERDPEDVPAVRTKPLSKKPRHTLPATDGISPTMPRFLPDGKSILFVRFEPDGQGFLHPDLFRWEIGSGNIERLTREADLREPDPGPDGTWALAVRNKDGLSQVVRVDLASGAVQALTEPSVEAIYDQPRVSPDGKRAVWARHAGGVWRLVLRDLEAGPTGGPGSETELASPPDATVSSPAWSGDGKTVYATVGSGGFIDIWAFPVDPPGPPVPVIRSPGAALDPAPTPDGKALFYLAMEADGLDLRRLDLGDLRPGASPEIAGLPSLPAAELVPAIRPPPAPPPAPFTLAQVPPGRPYGLGRQELLPLLSGSTTSSGVSSGVAELGVRGGDLVGRLDWLVLGGLGNGGGDRGGAVAAAYRGLPVALSFHLFDLEQLPARQSGRLGAPARSGILDREERGGEVRAEWDRRFGPARLRLAGGGLYAAIDPRLGESANRALGFLDLRYRAVHSRGRSSLEEGVHLHGESGAAGGDSLHRYGGDLTLGVGHESDRLLFTFRRDRASGTPRPYDLLQVGGFGSSLTPESALAGRVAVPALPAGTLLGRDYEGERAEFRLSLFPAPLFFERHRMDNGDWLRLAGLEWRFSTPPLPLGRIPAFDLRVGAARVFDPPFKGETRWWLVTVMRP